MTHKFATLDGLRGVAAISVMAFHRRDWFGGDEFFGHAFLAVDFFFLLSGFVLAHAYGDRLKRPGSFGGFVRERVLRLHPMLVAGAVLALIVALLEARMGGDPLSEMPMAMFFAHSVPFPAFWGASPAAFPWNIAIWSLFWELLVNLLFAAAAPWLTNRRLTVIVALSILIMGFVSTSENGFQVGFARDLHQFVFGFPRVCASFFLGVLLFRRHTINLASSSYLGAACTVVLVATFTALPLGSSVSVIYDPLIAYGLYPVLLLVAARAKPKYARLTSALGAISYPLYVIHESMLRVVGGVLTMIGASDGRPDVSEAIVRLGIVTSCAVVALKLYDEPLRRTLRRWSSKGMPR